MKNINSITIALMASIAGSSAKIYADTLLFSTNTNGTAFIESGPLKDNIVDFEWINDRAIYQGDIILNVPKPGTPIMLNNVITTYKNAGWLNAQVPFFIQSGVDRTNVLRAISHWRLNSTFKFTEMPSGFAGDSIVFTTASNVCQSYVGRIGGPQNIEIDIGCKTGDIIHEIGHAIGFLHEHTRNDRDQYVKILYENIKLNAIFNFDVSPFSEDYGPYDFASIMHYPLNAFSSNGKNTIEPIVTVPQGTQVGQTIGLSAGDKLSAQYLAGFRLQVASTDMCLHPMGGAALPDNWTRLVTWPSCSKDDRISFQLTPKGSLKQLSSGKCIHAEWGATLPSEGTPAVFWDSCDEDRLAFTLTEVGELKHKPSGKCLGTSSDNAETPITFQTCNGSLTQRFKKIAGQTLKHTGGLCVAAAGVNNIPTMNTPATLASCEAASILKFDLTASGLIYNSEYNLCLHPEGGSGNPGNGTRLVFFPACTPDTRLKFKVTSSGSLQHLQSGKCIHPSGGAAKPNAGTNLVFWDGCSESRLKFEFN